MQYAHVEEVDSHAITNLDAGRKCHGKNGDHSGFKAADDSEMP